VDAIIVGQQNSHVDREYNREAMADEIIRLTRAQVREYDRRAVEEYGIPGIELMRTAARGVAEETIRNFHPKSVLIVCGNGNNGGDGYALAPMLRDVGIQVSIHRTDPNGKLSPDASYYFSAMKDIPIVGQLSGEFDLLIDAIFGTGLTRAPEGHHAEVICEMNASRIPILAVDVPSGLDCDTGQPLGECIRARMTVTFVAEKLGFSNPRSREFTGEVVVKAIIVARASRTCVCCEAAAPPLPVAAATNHVRDARATVTSLPAPDRRSTSI
jgi:NAD(P)H-hydrate epimerase